ncbi:MAG: hypothetical protein WDW38_003624 [Sanguina aurantia]
MLPPIGYPSMPATSISTKFVAAAIRSKSPIHHVVWTPDGRRCMTGSNNGELTLWDGTTFAFETMMQAHDASPVRCMRYSHHGRLLLSCDDKGRVKIWKDPLDMLHVTTVHREPCRSVTWSPTDIKYATCSDDSTVKVHDVSRGHELTFADSHPSLSTQATEATSAGWTGTPPAVVIASCSKDALVKLWDPRSSNTCVATLHGHKSGVNQVQWNRNGNWLLSAGKDQILKVFDARTQKELGSYRGHAREVTCATWHPFHEELFSSASSDGSLMHWLVSRPDAQADMPCAHPAPIFSLNWHPMGHCLATAGGENRTHFWCRARTGDIWETRNLFAGDDIDNEAATDTQVPAAVAAATAKPAVIPGIGEVSASTLEQLRKLVAPRSPLAASKAAAAPAAAAGGGGGSSSGVGKGSAGAAAGRGTAAAAARGGGGGQGRNTRGLRTAGKGHGAPGGVAAAVAKGANPEGPVSAPLPGVPPRAGGGVIPGLEGAAAVGAIPGLGGKRGREVMQGEDQQQQHQQQRVPFGGASAGRGSAVRQQLMRGVGPAGDAPGPGTHHGGFAAMGPPPPGPHPAHPNNHRPDTFHHQHNLYAQRPDDARQHTPQWPPHGPHDQQPPAPDWMGGGPQQGWSERPGEAAFRGPFDEGRGFAGGPPPQGPPPSQPPDWHPHAPHPHPHHPFNGPTPPPFHHHPSGPGGPPPPFEPPFDAPHHTPSFPPPSHFPPSYPQGQRHPHGNSGPPALFPPARQHHHGPPHGMQAGVRDGFAQPGPPTSPPPSSARSLRSRPPPGAPPAQPPPPVAHMDDGQQDARPGPGTLTHHPAAGRGAHHAAASGRGGRGRGEATRPAPGAAAQHRDTRPPASAAPGAGASAVADARDGGGLAASAGGRGGPGAGRGRGGRGGEGRGAAAEGVGGRQGRGRGRGRGPAGKLQKL